MEKDRAGLDGSQAGAAHGRNGSGAMIRATALIGGILATCDSSDAVLCRPSNDNILCRQMCRHSVEHCATATAILSLPIA